MKSAKRIVISILVLVLIMVGCFITGGVFVAKGAVDMVQGIDLEQLFSDSDIREWVDTMVKYMEHYSSGELISYNSEYVSMPYSQFYSGDMDSVDTIVIEDMCYDLTVKKAFRSDVLATFKGKYPSSAVGAPIAISFSGGTLTIERPDASSIFDSSVGTATVNIPDDFNGTVIIKNCVGDMDILDLAVEELTIKSSAGEISGEKITADKLSIHAVTGEAEISGTFGIYDVENCIGEFLFASSEIPNGDSSVKNCIGEMKFELPEGASVYVIKDNSIAEIDSDIEVNAMGSQFEIENFIGEVRFDND